MKKKDNKEKDIKIESNNMKKMFLMTIVLCLLHSILLVHQDFGINVVLFTIPLLGTIIYFLKENIAIKNKMGLLILIPILILSSTYFVYSNVFNSINILKKTGFLSFIMSGLWIIDLLIMMFIIKNTYINYIIVLLFLFILFLGVGIALWTLSLLFSQATKYKEENDLTI